MIIEVIEYNRTFPEGHIVNIDYDRISKFYATPFDCSYLIYSGEDWIKDNQHLIDEHKLFTMTDGEFHERVGYVKPDCHPVMIEDTKGSYYFSDLELEEFIEMHTSFKHDFDYCKIHNRWEILDL